MKDNSFTTPILIICFNRPQYVHRQINALRLIKPSKIYISADGPRIDRPEEWNATKLVREYYLAQIDWKCNIKTQFHEINLGCFKGVTSALKWFFAEEEKGIILEDDIIPSLDFFQFTEEMLIKYSGVERIFSISGFNFGYQGIENSYSFCKIMNMWGWATWRDRYESIDFTMQSWINRKKPYWFLYNRLKNHIFDLDINWWIYWFNIFNHQKNINNVNTWDYQVIYNQLEQKKLTIYPNVNLIENIGFEHGATHTNQIDNPASKIKCSSLTYPIIQNKKIKHNKILYEKFMKPIWALYTRPNWKYYIGKLLRKK